MRNNYFWFESPLHKHTQIYNFSTHKNDIEKEQQEQIDHQLMISPEHSLGLFRMNQNNYPQSPWSKLLNQGTGNEKDMLPQQENGGYENQIIEERLVFSQDDQEDPVTPVRESIDRIKQQDQRDMHTTAKKSQAEIKKSRPRQKGLRKLSQRAFEIVQELNNATYKEVATKLVSQLNQEQFEGENKEEQNIKRRVYDALNVLIALGVLRKDGRKIVSEKGGKNCRNNGSSQNQQLQLLKMRLQSKILIVKDKKKRLDEAEQKFILVSSLLKRNKKLKSDEAALVPFPFIGLILSEQIQQTSKFFGQQFLLKSKQPLHPFGDIDCLNFLKQQSISTPPQPQLIKQDDSAPYKHFFS